MASHHHRPFQQPPPLLQPPSSASKNQHFFGIQVPMYELHSSNLVNVFESMSPYQVWIEFLSLNLTP